MHRRRSFVYDINAPQAKRIIRIYVYVYICMCIYVCTPQASIIYIYTYARRRRRFFDIYARRRRKHFICAPQAKNNDVYARRRRKFLHIYARRRRKILIYMRAAGDFFFVYLREPPGSSNFFLCTSAGLPEVPTSFCVPPRASRRLRNFSL